MSVTRSTTEINSALSKHVARFADDDHNFSPATVSAGLDKIHSSHPSAKGAAIATFNATHMSSNIVCPVTGARFVADEKTGYGNSLHLGTTRIWNADGSINEERWEKFAAFVTDGQRDDAEKVVPYSKVKAYLAKCYAEDAQESTTGRNTHSIFSSKYVQGYAATAAWDETFDRLTCGWQLKQDHPQELEPYIHLSLVRLFFEDSVSAFQKAEAGELPVARPELAVLKI